MSNHWKCPKCDSTGYDTDDVRVTGSGLSRFFNVQNRKFTAVTCDNCNYTEFYRGESSMLGNIVDFFGN